MIRGQDVWNVDLMKDMCVRTISGKEFFTFNNLDRNYYEVLNKTTEKNPKKTAFVDNWGRKYTYEKFTSMVDDFSQYLTDCGMDRKRHIGILLDNSIEFCVAFYSICKIGAVAVPFPSKYRKQEVESLVEKSDLDHIVIAERFEEWNIFESDKTTVSCDDENGYGFRHLRMKKGERGNSKGDLDDEAVLMFTSGTTSESKGVVMKNYNIIHATKIYERLCGITKEDSTIIPVPIYHVTGLIALLGVFIGAGGTIYLNKRYEAKRILETVRDNNISFMHGSPTVFNLMLDEKFEDLPSIRMILCGSSYLPVEKLGQLHKWLKTSEIRTVFGMTETASPGTLFPKDTATSEYQSSSGKPVPGLELKIVDDNDNELEANKVGSVYIRGTNVVEYYYKTKSPLFHEGGWLDTGDMGYYNEEGYVFFVDRKKDMINRGGEKIWCTDLEDNIIKIDGIDDAAVVGIPSDKYGEVAAAVVKRTKGINISEEEIKSVLKSRIARFKIPEKIIFVDKIPKTKGLKTDKNFIRQLFKKEDEDA